MTSQQRSAAARKAAKTTRARKQLRAKYGDRTYQAARLNWGLGKNVDFIAMFLGESRPTTAARIANITRAGALNELVYECNF